MTVSKELVKQARALIVARKPLKARSLLQGNVGRSDSAWVKNPLAFSVMKTRQGPKDLALAKRLYGQNARKGNGFAQHGLAAILEREGKHGEAWDWLEKSSQTGNGAATFIMAKVCFKNNDKPGMLKYLKLAAEQGDVVATQRYAVFQVRGQYGIKPILPGLAMYFRNMPKLIAHVKKMDLMTDMLFRKFALTISKFFLPICNQCIQLLISWVCLMMLSFTISGQASADDDAKFQATFNDPIKLPHGEFFTSRLNMAAPLEGYYSCGSIENSLRAQLMEYIVHTNYMGFDLFSNGTYRLRRRDKTFDTGLFNWKHNPVSGRVVFVDGPLASSFEWPIHLDYWKLTHWISSLDIKDQVDSEGVHYWILCRSDDPPLSVHR